MSLSFKKGWQSDIGVIVKNFNEYYFAFEEPNFYKLDKKFYSKLDALKLDEGDTDNVYFVSNIDFDISKLENSELNQKLENAEFMIFSELDGTRVI